jgi:hypothetical protein
MTKGNRLPVGYRAGLVGRRWRQQFDILDGTSRLVHRNDTHVLRRSQTKQSFAGTARTEPKILPGYVKITPADVPCAVVLAMLIDRLQQRLSIQDVLRRR